MGRERREALKEKEQEIKGEKKRVTEVEGTMRRTAKTVLSK